MTYIHLAVVAHGGDKRHRPRGNAPGHELIHRSIVQILARFDFPERTLGSESFVFRLDVPSSVEYRDEWHRSVLTVSAVF